MSGTGERALNALQEGAREQLRAAIHAEQQASWVAAVMPIGLWLWVLRAPILLGFSVLIFAMTAVRSRAFPAIDRGEIERAVVYFMVGKWVISIALVVVLPIALPIVVVNLIMPIALASTNLSSSRFVPVIVASVAVASVAAVFGYTTNLLALDDEVEPWLWQWLCAIVLAVHFVPLSIILWLMIQQQSLTYTKAIEANADLEAADAQLRSSRRRLVGAADAERSRIERDLHDGAQQQLVSVLVRLRLGNRLAEQGVVADEAVGVELADDLEAAIANLRALAHGIYPPLLKSGGLARALLAAGRQSSTTVTVEAVDVGRFEQSVEAAVYFCCLEAMQNAVKHGPPSVAVDITLTESGGVLTGFIRDDGPGFAIAEVADGSGLANMSDRIGAAGGTLSIDSQADAGTTVSFRLPAARSDAPRRPEEAHA